MQTAILKLGAEKSKQKFRVSKISRMAAEMYGNDERVEALWAIKAMEHAEVYFNVSQEKKPAIDPSLKSPQNCSRFCVLLIRNKSQD